MKDKLKCMVGQLFLLYKLREHLDTLRVEHENARKRVKFYREIGNMKMARVASKTLNSIQKSIKAVQKEIEKLEKGCS
ncbi:hypothetical protein J7K27_07430 [Candidatus Bathyarchaeota archaeon]|nr:hypothetical protein [Candidatus Bathyarchaeota archaeon]